jgi:hypothetical protein
MKTDFDQKTSEGIYSWTSQEVFEALSMWCQVRGISLKDKNKVAFDCSGDPHFVVQFVFNGKNK